MTNPYPTLDDIRATRDRLGDLVVTTSVRRLRDDALAAAVGESTEVWLKEELFQYTGSFKPRGALSVMLRLAPDALARGVTGVSAGNHAMALAFASRTLGTTATVVMPRTANAFRVARCRELGATVELVDNITEAFARVREIEAAEGRTFVHPYEGPFTALGTATVGLEFIEQTRAQGASLDAVVVAAGGGGLTGGVACAIKLLSPSTAVYVVEPTGADTMARSFVSRQPESLPRVNTIADSLGAPRTEPYSLSLNLAFVDEVVLVTDAQIRDAMRLLFRSAKLVTEPAGAAALAALMYPLRERLEGQRVGVVVCGGNTDAATFGAQLADTTNMDELASR
ncbi:MAG TPA: pyridoxal-phosphate dependent enzyme [Gemmatimonas sp.]|nr:pyridoxal-phosphate dependent enzyme [Gemmatimonas sp.]